MKLAPVRIDGMQTMVAADEIQVWKFPQMDTHVGFWLIVPPRRSLPSRTPERERLALSSHGY